MSPGDEVLVRPCESEYVKYLMRFAKDENWDYSMYDHRSLMRLDPTFLLVAVDNNSSQPIGFAGLSRITPDLYYFHNFIVRKDRRGQGIGKKLWEAMLAKAGDKCVALDGVIAMVPWYDTNGFSFQSFKSKMYETQLSEDMKVNTQMESKVKLMCDSDWPSLIEYDRMVYQHIDREHVLRAWFMDEDVKVYIAMIEESVVGYGGIHKDDENTYVLRNVCADNEDVFEGILKNMFESLPVGTYLRFWFVGDKSFPKYLQAVGTPLVTAQRLYTKLSIDINTEKLWISSIPSI